MCRNPLHCIVPPHVLTYLVEHGKDTERARELKTLTTDFGTRAARIQNAKQRAFGPREGADVLATIGPTGPNRVIRNADHHWSVTLGKIVRREGDPPTGDRHDDEAYDGLGDTYAFFADLFGRNSIDDEGMPLRAVTHFGVDYDNAFWDGRRMVFGDGDGFYFHRFTRDLDVIAHELGHGVTEAESGLEYWGQPGALNEHLSDVWGSLVEQYKNDETADKANWLIGDRIIQRENFPGKAIRSLKAPGTAFEGDIQPRHWRDYVRTPEDNGGVHINSGIPNHAFYTIATKLGGRAWERAGRIWYAAARHPDLRSTATFRQFARITIGVAGQLHGAGATEVKAVRDGWKKVGLNV
jgi:Zn-dependent metalloprotease